MNLFNCNKSNTNPSKKVTDIHTPLGSVIFDAVISETQVSKVQPDDICNLGNDAHLFEWQTSAFDLNLLMCRPDLRLHNNIQVDACLAGMWRLSANSVIPTSEFSCMWTPGYKWIEAVPDTGENLSAWIWNNQDYQVHIGTEEAEVGFLHRAKAGLGMPARFAQMFNRYSTGPNEIVRMGDIIRLSERGSEIHLPELRPGELCQVHFVVAWSAYSTDNYNESTLCAVDCPPHDILAGAGCV